MNLKTEKQEKIKPKASNKINRTLAKTNQDKKRHKSPILGMTGKHQYRS